jgi:hypothetical protein
MVSSHSGAAETFAYTVVTETSRRCLWYRELLPADPRKQVIRRAANKHPPMPQGGPNTIGMSAFAVNSAKN